MIHSEERSEALYDSEGLVSTIGEAAQHALTRQTPGQRMTVVGNCR